MVKYKRVGRCNPKACGAFCCRVGPLIHTISEPIDSSAYSLYDLFNWKHEVLNNRTCVYPNHTCSKLRGVRCSIYKTRPSACTEFPYAPDNQWFRLAKQNGCTYSFIKVKEAKEKPAMKEWDSPPKQEKLLKNLDEDRIKSVKDTENK